MVASVASSAALRWVWVVAAVVMSLKLALGRDDWRLGDRLPASRGLDVAAFLLNAKH